MAKKKSRKLPLIRLGELNNDQIKMKGRDVWPTIPGVSILVRPVAKSKRRVLLVGEPNTPLAYTVVLKNHKQQGAGDHFHEKRQETICLIDGKVTIVTVDMDPKSLTYGRLNAFRLDRPGQAVHIGTKIAHVVLPRKGNATISVYANAEYDPHDDTTVELAKMWTIRT